jgi:DNA-binding winged helix-turn-helix (wHTH) protein/TolB-like protein
MTTTNEVRQPGQGPTSLTIYQFGPFVLDTLQHTLLKEGKPVALTPKTYDTLLLLVQNHGRMMSKDELMKTLWPDSFVEEANVTQQVSMIRKALGESSSDPHYIHTIPARGYRFVAEVQHRPEAKLRSDLSVPAEHLSAEGTQTTESARENQRSTPLSGKKDQRTFQRAILIFAIAGVLSLAVLGIARLLYRRPSAISQPQVPPRSLAILPLHNLRQTPNDDFLGFSLADAVITKLDYISSLVVRPSSAVEKYRDQVIDIQRVGSELNVDTLLTGSYIRDHDNLRINYQLIDVKTDKLLGKGSIDLKYDDLLRVQDNVAQKIVQELRLNLLPSEAEKIKASTPVNPLAYEYFLRGVDLHSQHKFPTAIKMLEKSTDLDPTYAPAWAYLGASYTSDAAFELGGREQYRRAESAYERALAIQPSQLDAQIFLANFLVDTGKVEQAVLLVRDTLQTNPNYAAAHWELGYAYRFAGMLHESVAECERARQIDPLVKSNGSVLNAYLYLGEYDKFLASLPEPGDSAFHLFYRGFGEYHQKNWDQAAKDFDRAFELDPSLYTEIGKALSDSIEHRDADGLAILRALDKKIEERGVGDPEGTYKIAEAYSMLGDKPGALRALRSSVNGGFFSYPYLAADPMLDSLRGEPDFQNTLSVAYRRYQAFKVKFF